MTLEASLSSEIAGLLLRNLNGGFLRLGVISTVGGPKKKDYGILGSIVGSPDFGKLPIKLP